MNPSPAPFLDENGVTVTGTHITANGNTFELSKINSISVRRTPAWPLFDSLLKRPRTLQLVGRCFAGDGVRDAGRSPDESSDDGYGSGRSRAPPGKANNARKSPVNYGMSLRRSRGYRRPWRLLPSARWIARGLVATIAGTGCPAPFHSESRKSAPAVGALLISVGNQSPR